MMKTAKEIIKKSKKIKLDPDQRDTVNELVDWALDEDNLELICFYAVWAHKALELNNITE